MPKKKKEDTDSLRAYRRKRDFALTPEPSGGKKKPPAAPTFVVQKHAARRLHYDFRLEAGGVLKSWAIPKGPSADPEDKRLAVRTEDHPLEYAGFEGKIPEGQYGAGTVIVWDKGTYENLSRRGEKEISIEEGLEKGHISFNLNGEKLKGAFALTRIRKGEKEDWILVKKRDGEMEETESPVTGRPESVQSGKTLEEVRESPSARIWESNRARPEGGPSPELLEAARAKLRQAAQPRLIKPMLATLTDEVVSGEAWLFEPKLDGERCLGFRKGAEVRLVSRNGLSLNGNYPELAGALLAQSARDFIVDGEVVAFENGVTSFQKLQPRMQIRTPQAALQTGVEVFYYLFDLLYFDGYDLRDLDLVYRKGILREVIAFEGHVLYLEHAEREGEEYFGHVCRQGWEGLIAKRAGGRYVQGRSRDWLKIKCFNEQEFIICGYTEPKGSRTGFGALLLGYYDERRKLVYAGKVGTGYDERTLEALTAELEKLETPAPLYDYYDTDRNIPRRGVHWVKPALVAQIAFAEWTSEGMLRHPSFKGLRRDKRPAEVKREKAGAV